MDKMFSDVGEVGKRGGKGRVGQGMAIDEAAKNANKKVVSKLQRYLVSKGEISKGDNLSKKLKYADQIKNMNIPVLGQALLYNQNLIAIGKDLDTDTFNEDTIDPYIKELIPEDITDEEREKVKYRLYFTFYRYVLYVYQIEEASLAELRTAIDDYE